MFTEAFERTPSMQPCWLNELQARSRRKVEAARQTTRVAPSEG